MGMDNFWGKEENFADSSLEQDGSNEIIVDSAPAGSNDLYIEGEEEYYEYEEVEEVLDGSNPRIAEAIKRIEQAKLYESLLKHDFFAPGSARPEIQEKVTDEIRGFILQRLEELLGMQMSVSLPASPASDFNEDEKDALRAVAQRLTKKKNEGPVVPRVQQYRPNDSEVKINTANLGYSDKPKKVVKRVVRKAKEPTKENNPQPNNSDKMTKGNYQKPAISKKHPPVKMPPQAQIDALNAAQAARNAGGGGELISTALNLLYRSHPLNNHISFPQAP